MSHTYWSLPMHPPNIVKVFQTIEKLLSAQEFGLEIYSVWFTRKKNRARVVLLVFDTHT